MHCLFVRTYSNFRFLFEAFSQMIGLSDGVRTGHWSDALSGKGCLNLHQEAGHLFVLHTSKKVVLSVL